MKHRKRTLVAAVVAVIVILTSFLWFPAPVMAVDPKLQDFPSYMYSRNLHTFYAELNILRWEGETIPITDLKIFIYDDAGNPVAWVKFDYWGNIIDQSGHFAAIRPQPAPVYVKYPWDDFGYGYHYGYLWGYGYGFQPHWAYYPRTHWGYYAHTPGFGGGWLFRWPEPWYLGPTPRWNPPWMGGYTDFVHWWPWWWQYAGAGGYGYGEIGAGYRYRAEPRYLVVFNTTGLDEGSYTAQLAIDVPPHPKRFLSDVYPFTIAAVPFGGGGGGAAGPAPPPELVEATGSIDLTPYLDASGRTITRICLTSPDGLVIICIPEGSQVLDAEGNPAGSLEVILLFTPPPPPGYALVGSAYDFVAEGTTFDPPATMTINYDPADIPEGVSEEDLVIAYWDGDEWVMLATTIDPVADTARAEVAHFTPFALLAPLPAPPPAPAAFAVSDLTVSPAEVDIGETVTITALVSNTGELSGSYEVTLKIDGVAVATDEVTLAGGASQEVTFTTAKDAAGTYTVDVNGLAGEFVVREAPAPPPPPAPPVNWGLIGGIIAAVVVIGIVLWLVLARRRA